MTKLTSNLPALAPGLLALLAAVAGCGDQTSAKSDENIGATSSAYSFPYGTVHAPIAASPGFPEGVVVVGSDVFVSLPATNGTAGQGPSQVLRFDVATGAAKPTITITGENLATDHGLSCITSDASGRLYVLSTQLGVVRLTPSGSSWIQDIYSPPVPNLPACRFAPGPPCTPQDWEGTTLPNDLAFDGDGNLYITDSYQSTIFKVAPGGGPATIWFQSSLFEGIPSSIGLNGIRVSPDQSKILVTVTLPYTSPLNGKLYSIARVPSPTASDLQLLHTFDNLVGPDGIAFGANNKLYVAAAALSSIVVLSTTTYTEVDRYFGPLGSSIQFDGPANIAFNGSGSLFITNHAPSTRDASHFALLRVFNYDNGSPLFKPTLP